MALPLTPCVEHAQAGRYARVRRDGRLVCQHVAVWEDANGAKPDGWHVDHLCCNARCIRLDHLEAVPAIVNRRRARDVKLSEEIAASIRAEYAALPRATRRVGALLKTSRPVKVARGAYTELCRKYGLAPRYVREIVNREVWDDGC